MTLVHPHFTHSFLNFTASPHSAKLQAVKWARCAKSVRQAPARVAKCQLPCPPPPFPRPSLPSSLVQLPALRLDSALGSPLVHPKQTPRLLGTDLQGGPSRRPTPVYPPSRGVCTTPPRPKPSNRLDWSTTGSGLPSSLAVSHALSLG